VSARLVASVAIRSALRLPPATTLMMTETMMSRNTGVGCLNIAASTRPRNETSSSAFHEIAASQSKKDHHVTTTPLPISRRPCPVPIGGEAGPLLPRSAALAVSGRVWSVFTLDVGWPAVTGQITRRGRLPPARQD